jgi:hypothetical protein
MLHCPKTFFKVTNHSANTSEYVLYVGTNASKAGFVFAETLHKCRMSLNEIIFAGPKQRDQENFLP